LAYSSESRSSSSVFKFRQLKIFIKDFSKVARSLTDLIPDSSKKTKRGAKTAKVPSPNWHWEQEQDNSFRKLKDCLTQFPNFGFSIYGQPFEIHTDASLKGLGVVLYQLQDNQRRVIAYASRGLSTCKSEKNYPIHRLEFIALKWSITEKFSDYLYGTFDVITDNNPLTYVLSSAKLDATCQRCVASLATYDFNIFYCPSKCNSEADGLSRLPELSDVRDREHISVESIKSICNVHHARIPFVECLSMSPNVTDNLFPSELSDISEFNIKRESNAGIGTFAIGFRKSGQEFHPRKKTSKITTFPFIQQCEILTSSI
jgi:hypothetical protein